MKLSSSVLKQFAARVRETRIARGFSQEKLGARAGMHRTYIGMIERSEKNITLANMEKIAKALGVRIRDLVDF